jgi:hypothetical protein
VLIWIGVETCCQLAEARRASLPVRWGEYNPFERFLERKHPIVTACRIAP